MNGEGICNVANVKRDPLARRRYLAGTSLAVIECAAAPEDLITVRGLSDPVKVVAQSVRDRVAALSVSGHAATPTLSDDLLEKLEGDAEGLTAEIAAATGATVAFPPSDAAEDVQPRVLTLEGTRGQVEAAEAMVKRMQRGGSPDGPVEPAVSPFDGESQSPSSVAISVSLSLTRDSPPLHLSF